MTLDQVIGAGVLAATLRLATPILLAALGGVVSERSGVVNIALEGCMLVGAFFGVVAADRTHSVVLALAVAMGAGGILAAIHAVAAIHLRSDQIVSGMALNILALGLTSYLDYQFYGNTGTPADLAGVPDVSLGRGCASAPSASIHVRRTRLGSPSGRRATGRCSLRASWPRSAARTFRFRSRTRSPTA